MFRHYKEAFIRLFYPAACEVCHASLDLEERILCQSCAQKLDSLAWPMEKILVDAPFDSLDHAWTVYAYGSPARELLHGVKYARKDYLLKAFRDRAVRLAQAVTSDFWYDAILPIPIDRLKLMKRHFNQAEVLATLLAPWLTPPIRNSILVKRHTVPSQTSLSQVERSINVYGSFKLKCPAKVRGRSFLLLDDVLTTGSTANEAARLLKLHGAKRVDFLALTRTATDAETRSLALAPENCQSEECVTERALAKTV